ncbi:MAG: FAD-dependent oxidoreductase, partial [Myxococcales bacterium]|nr:FAD-dependent oxidoreductase [Myxococcales bacterium]
MNDLAAPFLGTSAWIDAPEDPRPPLAGDARADVAIVGGGLTGLSTAIALRDAGVDVALVERAFCGAGASGRNAGHLTPTIGKDMPTLRMMFGEERAGALVRFADHCVARTEARIAELGIACDYQPSGNVMAAVHASQERRLRRAADAAAKAGARVAFLEADAMRARGLPGAFLCGAHEAAGGTLDPGHLVRGLRAAALARGVRLHEGTEVREVVPGAKPVVRTRDGSLEADRVVLATNAWTRTLRGHGREIVPLYVTLFESAPLDDAHVAALGGWPSREGVYTAHEALESYRLTSRRTIVGGSKAPRYAFGSRPRERVAGAHAGTQRAVARAFRDRFPELADVPIAHYWGGWIAMTLSFLPSISPRPARGVVHAAGFNGHGVAQATATGELLASALAGRPDP